MYATNWWVDNENLYTTPKRSKRSFELSLLQKHIISAKNYKPDKDVDGQLHGGGARRVGLGWWAPP